MSDFESHELPIDYTNKYNENIGTISPRSRYSNKLNNSHLTSYHSANLYASETNSIIDQPMSQNCSQRATFQIYSQLNQQNQCINQNMKYNQNNSNSMYTMNNQSMNCGLKNNYSSQEFNRFAHVYQEGTADSVTCYRTEDTPICFSNNSPLSSLSIEYLPTPDGNDFDFTLNRHTLNDTVCHNSKSFHPDLERYSIDDSVACYNVEGSPLCLSYDSPISALSLDFGSDGEISPPSMEYVQEAIKRNNMSEQTSHSNNNQDITSMMSVMSIDNNLSRSSHIDSTNRKSEQQFGQLTNHQSSNDDLSMFNYNIAPKSMFNVNYQSSASSEIVNKNSRYQHESHCKTQSSQSSDNEHEDSVDFENGFDHYDNEQRYLNECISLGRRLSNNHQSHSSSIQSNSNLTSQSHSSSMQSNCTLTSQSNIRQHQTQNSISSFDRTHDSRHHRPTVQTQSHSMRSLPFVNQTNHLFTFDNQDAFTNQSNTFSNETVRSKIDQKINHLSDNETVITNFTSKFSSRSSYPIDGEEEQREATVAFQPITRTPCMNQMTPACSLNQKSSHTPAERIVTPTVKPKELKGYKKMLKMLKNI